MIILGVMVLLAVAFMIYWYKNMHWYDKYEKALEKAGAKEKQVTLPNGNVINYGEVENDKPALLLIHGQMSIWEDYALVLPELSKIRMNRFRLDFFRLPSGLCLRMQKSMILHMGSTFMI